MAGPMDRLAGVRAKLSDAEKQKAETEKAKRKRGKGRGSEKITFELAAGKMNTRKMYKRYSR